MPAWFSHPGVLIIGKIGKKRKLSGLALVWGSLTPDLEFVPQITLAIATGNYNALFTLHMQGLFHSIFGVFFTVPLAVFLTIVTAKPLKRILKWRIFSVFKIRNLDYENVPQFDDLRPYFISATIGVLSAIFLDWISHDSITMLYPFAGPIPNPLISFGIDPFSLWLSSSILLFLLFLIALYEYPYG